MAITQIRKYQPAGPPEKQPFLFSFWCNSDNFFFLFGNILYSLSLCIGRNAGSVCVMFLGGILWPFLIRHRHGYFADWCRIQ